MNIKKLFLISLFPFSLLTYSQEPSLYEAVEANNISEIQSLIKQGADPNSSVDYDKYGLTPILIWAVSTQQLEIVKLLIEKGADIDIEQTGLRGFGSDDTPLTEAAKIGNLELVKLLVDNNANVNKANKWGRTPLDYAQEINNKSIMNFLISKGAKYGKKYGKFTELVLNQENYETSLENIKTFIKKENINLKDEEAGEVLELSIIYGDGNVIEYLIKEGIFLKDDIVGTAISYYGYYELAKLLVENGAEVKDEFLVQAMRRDVDAQDTFKLVQLLLDNGAEINGKDRWGKTALDMAKEISENDPEWAEPVIKFLKSKGAK